MTLHTSTSKAFEQLLSVLLTVFQVTAEERPAESSRPATDWFNTGDTADTPKSYLA